MIRYSAFITTDKFVTAIYEGGFTKKSTIKKALKWAKQAAEIDGYENYTIKNIQIFRNGTNKIRPCFECELMETITF